MIILKKRRRPASNVTGETTSYAKVPKKKQWNVAVIVVALSSTALSLFVSTIVLQDSETRQQSIQSVSIFSSKAAAIIVPSQCKEDVTSKWVHTSLPREYPQYRRLSDFLEGPAFTIPHPDSAICEFRYIRYWFHFPHT